MDVKIELQVFNWESEEAKTKYSTCGLERDMEEVDTNAHADDIEVGRVTGSWVFCARISEGIRVGEPRAGDAGDKDVEEFDTVWLLPSESGTLKKSTVLLLPVLIC